MQAIRTRNSAGWSASAILSSTVLLGSCASTPVVTRDSNLQAHEGLVAVRLLDLGDVAINRFSVQSEATGEVYPLRAIHFGQTTTATFIGRLPAGRYHPKELTGIAGFGGYWRSVTSPLEHLTGKFDVAAGRATQLGTIVYYPVPGSRTIQRSDSSGVESTFQVALPLVPAPVPVEPMLAARFPDLAKASAGTPALGWLSGTVPAQLPEDLDLARKLVRPMGPPTFLDATTYLAGGALGVIREQHADGTSARSTANTVHMITAVLPLQDGRWLAGGEEGYLAMSINRGKEWHALPPLAPDEIVLYMTQREDTQLFMVTDREREIAVYESSDNPISWKEIKRIPSSREQRFVVQALGENAHFLPDFAASSNDRLVILTRPGTLSSFHFRTRQWENFDVPRTFGGGFKVTPDGYVVGIASLYWIYGSHDYGKTWKRLEAWLHMTEPHFFDRNRGVMLAAEMQLSAGAPYKVRTTKDGGQTWQTGADVEGWATVGPPLAWGAGQPVRPLWSNPTGRVLYTVDGSNRVSISHDGGVTWEKE